MTAPWDPPADDDLAPFWAAARERRLDVPVCTACGHVVLRPRAICPICHDDRLEWRTVSGRGTVYSYGVEQRDIAPDTGLTAPYVVALVELEEGGRLVSNVLADPDEVHVDLPVEVVFAELPDGRVVPRFRPS
jgi:uncharacterized OB-fold protein